MDPDIIASQTSHEGPSALKSETFRTPLLLPICCMCGLIRDEKGSSPGLEPWLTRRTYRKTHGVNPLDFTHTHTYCPKCLTKVRETTAQYFRQIETLP